MARRIELWQPLLRHFFNQHGRRDRYLLTVGTYPELRGIIGFDIHFSDATGHLDTWDGTKFSAEKTASKDYFTLATRVWVWTAK